MEAGTIDALHAEGARIGWAYGPDALVKQHRAHAVARFRRLNGFRTMQGWRVFPLPGSRRFGGPRDAAALMPYRDHSLAFTRPGGIRTLISQPYLGPSDEVSELITFIRKHGFKFEVPPDPFASFWYPGSAAIFAVTNTPDAPPIQWLPEQCGSNYADMACPRDAELMAAIIKAAVQ